MDIKTLREQAQTGDTAALNALGNAYMNGEGVEQDTIAALNAYQKAADGGFAPAAFNLGLLHELGRGVPLDLEKAFAHYRRAAELGFPAAQFNVGNMYARGLGVRADPFEAVLWFRQAAEAGIPDAQYNLAVAYETGRGVTADFTQAKRWYQAATDQGYARGAYNLALMHEEGRGIPRDDVMASRYYKLAAEKNYGPAQNNLGIMYAEGRGGLTQSFVEAYPWLVIAAENGADARARDMVLRRLDRVQKAEGDIKLSALRVRLGVPPPGAVAATSTPPDQVIAGADAAEPVLSSKVIELESELDRLRRENAGLVSANQSLARQKNELEQRSLQAADPGIRNDGAMSHFATIAQRLKDIQPAGESAQRTLAEAAAMLTVAAEENRQLNAEVKRATLELGAMGRRLREAERRSAAPREAAAVADSEAVAELAAARDQIVALQGDLVRTRARVGSLEKALGNFDDIGARLEKVTAENVRLTAGIEEVNTALAEARRRADAGSELQAALAAREQELAQLRTAGRKTEADLAAAGTELTRLRGELSRQTENMANLVSAELLTASQARVAELETLVSDATADRDRVADLDELEQRLARTAASLQSEQARTAELSRSLEDARKSEANNLKRAEALAAALEQATARSEQATAELAVATSDLATVRSRVAQLAPLENVVEERAAAQTRVTALESELQQSRAEIERLSDRLAKETIWSADLEEANGRINRLRSDLEQALTQRDAIQKNVTEQAILLKERGTEIEQLNARLAQAEIWADDLEEANARVNQLTAGMEHLAMERAALAEQLATSQQKTNQAVTELGNLRARLAASTPGQEELEAARVRISALGEELDSAQEATKQLSAELAESRSTLAEVRTQVRVSEQARAAAAAEVATFRARVSAAEAETERLTGLASQVSTLQNQLAERESQVAKLRTRVTTEAENAAQLEAAVARIAELDRELNTARSEANAAEERRVASEARIKALVTELASSQSAVSEASAELLTLRDQLTGFNRMKTELGDAHARLATLTSELDRAQGARVSLENAITEARAARDTAIVERDQAQLRRDTVLASSGENQQRVVQTENEVARLNDVVAKAEESASLARTRAQVLEAQLATMQGRIQKMDEAAIAARTREQGLVEQLAVADEKLAALQSRAQSAEQALSSANVDELRHELERARQDAETNSAALAKAHLREVSLNEQVKEAKDRIAALEPLATASAAATNDLALWKDLASKADLELQQTRQELSALRVASAEAQQNFQTVASVQLEASRQSEIELERITQSAAELQAALVALEAEKRDSALEIERLRQEIDLAEGQTATIDRLQQELALARSGTTEAQREIQRLSSELLARGEAFQDQARETTRLQTELENLFENRSQLATELEQARQRLTVAENEVESLSASLASQEGLDQALRSARSKVAELQQEKDRLGAANANLDRELKQVREAAAANANVTAEIATVRSDLAKSRARVTALERDLTELRTSAEAVESEREGLLAKTTELESTLAEAIASAARWEQQAARLNQQAQSTSDLATELATLRATGARERDRIATLEAELAAATQAAEQWHGEVTQLNARLESVGGTSAELEATVASLTEARRVIAGLQDELQQARSRVGELDTVAAARVAAETTSRQLQAENNRLRDQLASAQTAQSKLGDQAERLNELATVRDAALQHAEQLARELEVAQNALDENGATIAELTGENLRLQGDLDASQKAVAAALAAQATAANQADMNPALEMEVATLQGRVAQVEETIAIERASAAKEFAALSSQLQRARQTNQSLIEANRSLLATRELDETASRDRLADLEREVAQLAQSGADLKAENLALQTALAEAKAAPQAPAAWQTQQQALASRVEALNQQLTEAQAYRTQVETLSATKDDLLAEQAALQARVAAALEQQATTAANNDALTAELARSRDDAAALESQLTAMSAMSGQLEAVQGELTSLRGSYDSLSRENDALAAQVAKAEAAAETRAGDALAEWTAERERLAAEITRLRGSESDLLQRIEGDQTQLTAATSALEDARRRIAALERTAGQAAAQSDELAALAARIKQAEQELGTQRSANLRLQDVLSQERQTQEARLVAAQRENAALSGRLRQAQNTLDQIAAAARVMNPNGGNPADVSRSTYSPPTTAGPAPARTHTVVEGDSLSRISMRYYGTPSRWQDIYQANRELLSEANALRPGQELRIP